MFLMNMDAAFSTTVIKRGPNNLVSEARGGI